ncbi:hypothetical protein [Sorangium sp. So ce1024]|uniref:hypothetical protein n=1 Tax=Sorangium sp. So ce1024 TaxID=3133327 RepID=UPI003F0A75DC
MLRATLAERLGLVSAAEADRREAEEHRTIDRRMRLLSGAAVRVDESPVERALRRSGMSGCPVLLRGLLPEPLRGAWCDMHWRETRGMLTTAGGCGPAPAGHTLVTAPALRAMRSGRETCGGARVDWRAPCLTW